MPGSNVILICTVDNHICRCGSSVFPVWAATVMLAGYNRNALGPKRTRGRKVVKGGKRIDFHNPYGD